jgi:hypothetical protein
MFSDELLEAVMEPSCPPREGFDVHSIRAAYAETGIMPDFTGGPIVDKTKMWPEHKIESAMPHVALMAKRSGMMLACVIAQGIPANVEKRIAKVLQCPLAYLQGFKAGWTDGFGRSVSDDISVSSDLVQGWCDGEAARMAIIADMN